MTRDEVILSIYNNPEVKSLARTMLRGSRGVSDLLQYVALTLCELPPEAIISLSEDRRINNFVYGIMRNQVFNARSEFNKYIRNTTLEYLDELQYDTIDESEYIDLPEFSDFLRFCEKKSTDESEPDAMRLAAMVTTHYLTYTPNKKRTFRDFQNETGIHYSSVCVYVNRMKQLFRQTHETASTTQQSNRG